MSVKQSWHNLWCLSSPHALTTATQSLPVYIPACRLIPLQRVQNAAARLVLNLDRRAHISPALRPLHWLPVKHRVTFKIATLMHQILQKRCPSCLADMVTFNTYSQRRHLRSSTTRSAAVYDAHELSLRSVHFLFAVLMCGIVFLLRFVISTVIHAAFRRALKSHLFSCAFSITVIPYINWHCNAQSAIFM